MSKRSSGEDLGGSIPERHARSLYDEDEGITQRAIRDANESYQLVKEKIQREKVKKK